MNHEEIRKEDGQESRREEIRQAEADWRKEIREEVFSRLLAEEDDEEAIQKRWEEAANGVNWAGPIEDGEESGNQEPIGYDQYEEYEEASDD